MTFEVYREVAKSIRNRTAVGLARATRKGGVSTAELAEVRAKLIALIG